MKEDPVSMKKQKNWHLLQLIQLFVFLGISALIWLREVDGSGAAQTPEIRRISFLCWLGFYLLLLAVEWIPHWLHRKK